MKMAAISESSQIAKNNVQWSNDFFDDFYDSTRNELIEDEVEIAEDRDIEEMRKDETRPSFGEGFDFSFIPRLEQVSAGVQHVVDGPRRSRGLLDNPDSDEELDRSHSVNAYARRRLIALTYEYDQYGQACRPYDQYTRRNPILAAPSHSSFDYGYNKRQEYNGGRLDYARMMHSGECHERSRYFRPDYATIRQYDRLVDSEGNVDRAVSLRMFGCAPPADFSFSITHSQSVTHTDPVQNRLSLSLRSFVNRDPDQSTTNSNVDSDEVKKEFEAYFDSPMSLAIFDKAFENSIWDYDPKFTCDYLPNTKRGLDEDKVKKFIYGHDYIQEEFKWKKWEKLIDNHWKSNFIPKVLEEKMKHDMGIYPELETLENESNKTPKVSREDQIIEYMLSNMDWPDDTCSVEYCSICNATFVSVMTSVEHYFKESHDRAVRRFVTAELKGHRQMTVRDLNTVWCDNLLQRLIKRLKTRPSKWMCVKCNVELTSVQSASAHVNGITHRRKMKGLPPIAKVHYNHRHNYDNWCGLCEVELPTDAHVRHHISDLNHIAKVKRAAEMSIQVLPGPSSMIDRNYLRDFDKSKHMQANSSARRGNKRGKSGRSFSGLTTDSKNKHRPGLAFNRHAPSNSNYKRLDLDAAFSEQHYFGSYDQPQAVGANWSGKVNERMKSEYHCPTCNRNMLNNEQYQLHFLSMEHVKKENAAAKKIMQGNNFIANANSANDYLHTIANLGYVPGRIVNK